MTRLGLLGLVLLWGCVPGTGALPPELEQRLTAEGIVHRADDQVFRYTYYSRSTRGNRWEERDASIIITPRTLLIHKNGKVGLELTSVTRKAVDISRNADRLTVAAGSGQSRVSWSFRPPSDAEGWTNAARAVLRADSVAPQGTATPGGPADGPR
jgi:hypothetical protein